MCQVDGTEKAEMTTHIPAFMQRRKEGCSAVTYGSGLLVYSSGSFYFFQQLMQEYVTDGCCSLVDEIKHKLTSQISLNFVEIWTAALGRTRFAAKEDASYHKVLRSFTFVPLFLSEKGLYQIRPASADVSTQLLFQLCLFL